MKLHNEKRIDVTRLKVKRLEKGLKCQGVGDKVRNSLSLHTLPPKYRVIFLYVPCECIVITRISWRKLLELDYQVFKFSDIKDKVTNFQ